MTSANPFSRFGLGGLFETWLLDFVLALVFFTALTYAVLGQHFGRQRTAAATSGVLGLALAIGLVWWEHDRGWSVRDLGPAALLLTILLLASVVYRAIGRVGGFWAGAGIALGLSILAAWILGFDALVGTEILQTVAVVALIVGLVALLVHLHGRSLSLGVAAHYSGAELADARDTLAQIGRDRRIANSLRERTRVLRKDSELLGEHSTDAPNVAAQLRRMLPEQGWLTERLAQLQARVHRIRSGHLRQIEELRHVIKSLPPEARKWAARELASRYQQLQLDTKLQRLEAAVAQNEQKIKDLICQAEQALARHDYRNLTELLESAERLQGRNSGVFATINRIEQRLAKMAQCVAQEAARGSGT